MAAATAMIDPWQAAYSRYIEDLNDEEQTLFKDATLDNLLTSTDTAQKAHEDESRSRQIFQRLEPFMNAIDQYSHALDIYTNAYPLVMAPLWGSIRVLLHIAKKFGKYFEKTTQMLARIGDLLPRCKVYQRLFPTNEKLLQAISIVYLGVIDFCWTVKKLFRRSTKHLIIKILWKDLDKEFDEKLNDFRLNVKAIEKQAGLSNMIEANEGWALVQLHRKVDKRDHLLSQLTPINYVNKQLKEHGKLHQGTCSWLTETVVVENWAGRSCSDCLWCYGIPGSGKTVLMSHLVDKLTRDALNRGLTARTTSSQDIVMKGIKGHETAITYHYCDFSDSRSLEPRNILGTIVRQLLETVIIPKPLEEKIDNCYRSSARSATETDLLTILFDALQYFTKVYILIDGLDECNKPDIKLFLQFLNRLLESDSPLLKIALFSRENNEIANVIGEKHPRIRVSTDRISLDISSFIKETVESKIACGDLLASPPLKREITRTLVDGAHGMFLWVHFQLLELCDAVSDNEIRKILQNLPQGMEATYTRILHKIAGSRTNTSLAQQMLKWIICAKRPMLLTELAEAVAFKPTDMSWGKEKVPDSLRLHQACGNLVVIDENDKTARLAHHTIQQFLLNPPGNQLMRPFHFQRAEADLEIGEICVAYLSFSDFETQIARVRSHNTLPTYPLSSLPAAILEGKISISGFSSTACTLFNFERYFHIRNRSYQQMNFDLSKFVRLKRTLPTQMLQEKYLFLNYAIEAWLSHTSSFSESNTDMWKPFKKLAINKPLPFDIRPWGDLDESSVTSYTKFGNWVIDREHIALMSLVPPNYFVENNILLRMAMDGHLPIVEILLARGVDIEENYGNGETPLLLAARLGHEALVELLLAKGAEIEAKNESGETALHYAASKGQTDIVDLLLSNGADIEAKNDSDYTALTLAVKWGHTGVIDLLLAKGADIEAKNEDGKAALTLAVEWGHPSVVDLLLTKGADIEAKDEFERTALMKAVIGGHTAVVDLLLTKGADIEAKDEFERTALMEAVIEGHTAVVELLLTKGADIEAKDGCGSAALSLAAGWGHTDVVELLLTKGADIEAKDGNGNAALSLAAERGHTDVVDLLLTKGADIEAKNEDGNAALTLAAEMGHTDVVDLLLAKGADTEAKNKAEFTALHLAAVNGHIEVAKLLVAYANVNTLSMTGKRAVDFAKIFRNTTSMKKPLTSR